MNQLNNILESILFVSGKAVEIKFIQEKLNVSKEELDNAIMELKQKYSGQTGIHLMIFNKKLQFCSNPEYSKAVESVLNPIRERELTNAMLESLAIIAYKQPVTKLELEEIRGVDSSYSVQNLLKLGMIEPVGRKDAIGKPVLYGTTDDFLKRFSLTEVQDLPDYQALLQKLCDIENSMHSAKTVEKPMFDMQAQGGNNEELPEFLQGEDVEVVE